MKSGLAASHIPDLAIEPPAGSVPGPAAGGPHGRMPLLPAVLAQAAQAVPQVPEPVSMILFGMALYLSVSVWRKRQGTSRG